MIADGVTVIERGMVLIQRKPEVNDLPERFQLWTVASVRKTAKGAAVKLLAWSPGALAEATATFPGGTVGGADSDWRWFGLSQRDYALVWSGRPE